MQANMAGAPLRLAHVFSDHAVLQRGMPVPVWGWAPPGARIRVTLGAYAAETLAGLDGTFLARLPAMPAGGPYVLEAAAANSTLRVAVSDVMVGEVWICSGQSNMEWTVRDVSFDPASLAADDTRIRSITVPRYAVFGGQAEVQAGWQVATPATVRDFTAVGFFFGRRLARELGVAVGLVNTSWGGTRIEAWMSRAELVQHDWTRHEVARYEASVHAPGFLDRFGTLDPNDPDSQAQLLYSQFPRDPGNRGIGAGWAALDHDTREWATVQAPAFWTSYGYNINGVFWYRREFTVPADWAGKDLALGVGGVDKHDITYFNGEQVGTTGQGFEEQHWNVPRQYTVPGRLVKAGRAVVAVRAFSFINDGGLVGPAEAMRVAPADGSAAPIRLDGFWQIRNEHDFGKFSPAMMGFGPGNQHTPYMLFANMIRPLIPYAIRGATWYQGESNADKAQAYGWMLRALIRDWRREWGQGDFPFLTVQLANYTQARDYDGASQWPRVREGQLGSLAEPQAGLAVAIDIGDADDIHPRNKQDVGWRLAQWALARTYGKPVVPSGPLYRELVVEGDRVRVRFDHAGGGLTARGGALKTFVIAALDRKFVPAEAVIEGDSVVVRSPDVAEPVAVRYAWADNPAGCNLYNAEGLPASPFRTDEW